MELLLCLQVLWDIWDSIRYYANATCTTDSLPICHGQPRSLQSLKTRTA